MVTANDMSKLTILCKVLKFISKSMSCFWMFLCWLHLGIRGIFYNPVWGKWEQYYKVCTKLSQLFHLLKGTSTSSIITRALGSTGSVFLTSAKAPTSSAVTEHLRQHRMLKAFPLAALGPFMTILTHMHYSYMIARTWYLCALLFLAVSFQSIGLPATISFPVMAHIYFLQTS